MTDQPLAPKRAGKQAEQQAFEQLNRLDAIGNQGRSFVDRLFHPLFAAFRSNTRDWSQDAHLSIAQQRVPRARGLLYGVALGCVLLLGWAALAEVDEVTRGEGKIIPSRQLQIVQSVDGGVVEQVFVDEGALVKEGDLLVRIDPTRFIANLQEGSVRLFALRTKVDRLIAQINDQPYQPRVGDAVLTPEQLQVLAQEKNYYEESVKELNERVAIAREQRTQRQQELRETEARLQAAERTHLLSTQELTVTRPLLRSGAVSEVDILRLQRDQTAAESERNQAAARVQQLSASVLEAEARLSEEELATRNQWRSELSEATAQLNSLDKNIDGLGDRVKFSEIRSPVNGTVQRVLLNTLGGVVQPGHAVVEIVPSDDRLLIEARISPKDIAFLRPGLNATIKLHAYDFAIYGGLAATLQHISADAITDERDNTYYLVRAMTTDAEDAQRLDVIPGMTAQLDIMTGKKTVLSYLLKPLLRAKANALSER